MMNEDTNQFIGASIISASDRIAEHVISQLYAARPELESRYGAIGKEKCLQDTKYHLSYLAQSVSLSRTEFFKDYIAWAKVMLAGRKIPAEDLALNLLYIHDAVKKILAPYESEIVGKYISDGIAALPSNPHVLPTFIPKEQPQAALAETYVNYLLDGNRHDASKLILQSVEDGAKIKDIYLNVFQQSQYEIGRLWQENKISVAQEHFCTAATQLIMSQLYPKIFSTERNGSVMVGACVGGDLHELGVRMVSDFFEMEGWDTFYLGASVPDESIIDTLRKRKANILALSVTYMPNVAKVQLLINKVRASDVGAATKIIVGGYPFNLANELWREIGADGYAANAQDAITAAHALLHG